MPLARLFFWAPCLAPNWHGEAPHGARLATPLVSYRVIIDLIAATTTKTGLKVLCELDGKLYPKGIAVSD
ncbi:MAG: ISAzo13-like element transposase-related protein, partial [Rhodomicrobium sp.]